MRLAANGLIGLGAALMLLAGVGMVRLPDVFSRMHAGTKAASLGLACVLAGAAILISDAVATVKLLLAVLFQFVTAPVAAHAIGRAAYRAGVPMWEGTRYDELGRHTTAGDEADAGAGARSD